MTEKPRFFHAIEFNVSLIIAFFQAFVGALVIVTAAGIHALGMRVSEELSNRDEPVKRIEAPKDAPAPIPEPGIPVALSSLGDGR